jgi:hypothetical protein
MVLAAVDLTQAACTDRVGGRNTCQDCQACRYTWHLVTVWLSEYEFRYLQVSHASAKSHARIVECCGACASCSSHGHADLRARP